MWKESIRVIPQNFYSPISANVLIAQEKPDTPVVVNYVNTKWCVDSGANRDICKDISLAQGRGKAKALLIGEAGQGHSFFSEAEGPIAAKSQGKTVPLLSRVIFAKKVHENIFSVA